MRWLEQWRAHAALAARAALRLGTDVSRDPGMVLAWSLRARDAGSALASAFLGPARIASCAVGTAAAERGAAPLPSEVEA